MKFNCMCSPTPLTLHQTTQPISFLKPLSVQGIRGDGQLVWPTSAAVIYFFFLLEIGWVNIKFIPASSWSCSKAVQLQSDKARGECVFQARVWLPFCSAGPPGGFCRTGKTSCNITGWARQISCPYLPVDHPCWMWEMSQEAFWALKMGQWSHRNVI